MKSIMTFEEEMTPSGRLPRGLFLLVFRWRLTAGALANLGDCVFTADRLPPFGLFAPRPPPPRGLRVRSAWESESEAEELLELLLLLLSEERRRRRNNSTSESAAAGRTPPFFFLLWRPRFLLSTPATLSSWACCRLASSISCWVFFHMSCSRSCSLAFLAALRCGTKGSISGFSKSSNSRFLFLKGHQKYTIKICRYLCTFHTEGTGTWYLSYRYSKKL